MALHGRDGEDGAVQELLELIGIPYTGSGPAGCMRCWDKVIAKYAMLDAGIPTPEFFAFGQAAFQELGAAKALPAIEERLEFPIVVKPASQGSALGIRVVRTPEEIPSAIVSAFSYDSRVLLERHVAGRDLAVSVIGGQGGPMALPVVEAVPHKDDFYDFEARYSIGRTTYACPADLPDTTAERARDLALQVFDLLGCSGVARVDLMLDSAGDALSVLEANAVPGLTETSLLPMAAEAAGISFDELVQRLLDLAFDRAAAAQSPAAT
jgi:D-alanine-D-alanine ligase